MGKFPDVPGAWALLFLPAAHRDLDSAAELHCKGLSCNALHREAKRDLSALMAQKSALGFANLPAGKPGASTQTRDLSGGPH